MGENQIFGAQSVDAAVSPDYRGQGVFTQLARMALKDSADDGVELVFAFPSQGAFGGQVRAGFEPQLVVPKAYRPLFVPPRRVRFSGLTLGKLDRFDDRFEVFSKGRRDHVVTVQRDPGYLRWRYHEHPTKTYETITCERDGVLSGYSVLTVNTARKPVSPGYVVDLQVVPGCAPAADFLAYHSLRRLRSLGARLAVSWERPQGPEQAAMRSRGFSRRYVSLRQRFMRSDYVDQMLVYADQELSMRDRLPRGAADDRPLWSLVPGDADYS